MFNKMFKSFFAAALVMASAVAFVACENPDVKDPDPTVEVSTTALTFNMEEGSQSVNITANAAWKTEVDYVDGDGWVTVLPENGSGDATITISVPANDTEAIREATVKVIALHSAYGAWDTKKIKISQSATNEQPVVEEVLYSDNFDGKEATKTFGSGSSWPYIDQFPEFANQEGPASENVTYSGSGVSVRANSTSNSSYSDYAGSGLNNIFFGASAYFQVNEIELTSEQNTLRLSFGTEKYSQDGDSVFQNAEFHVALSMDGYGWSEIEYTYAGTEGGRWNVATADFTLTEVPEKLYIKFSADVASVYRIDDVKLLTGNGGQEITLTPGEAPEPSQPGTIAAAIEAKDGDSVKVDEATVIGIYNKGFLMEDTTGRLMVYTNATAEVEVGTKVSVEGTVTTYAGFKQFAAVKDADGNYGAAPAVTVISSGSYTYSSPKVLDGAAMDSYLSSPYIEYVEYTGVLTISGSYYNVAVEGAQTAVGSIAYPIAGSVTASDGQEVVVRGWTIGVSGTKYVNTMLVECEAKGEAPEVEVKTVTIAEFLAAAEDSTWYQLTGVIGEVKSTDYGNFYMTDETGTTYVYGLYDEAGNKVFTSLGLKSGDTITLRGRRTSYKEEPQVGSAIYISHVVGEGGETPTPAEGPYASDAAFVNGTDDSTNCAYGLGDTVIDDSSATGFKLGTGSKSGYFKSAAVGVSGDKYLNFYGVAWKGKSATLYFRVDGGEAQSLALTANAGATGNSPYTALSFADSDHYSFKLSGLTASSVVEFSTDASFSAVESTAGRAIMCGVKLTDEPLGNVQGGGETPEPTPDVTAATVAEFLAAAEDSTTYELTGVITQIKNTTYGNFYLEDATGSIYVYGLDDESGTAINWESKGLTVGDTITIHCNRSSYNGTAQAANAVYVSHVDGEAPVVEAKKVSVAEFLAAAEDSTIYELTGTIANVANTYYGNFDLVDETGSVYVYGIYDENGNKVFESLGLKAGDVVTLKGRRTSYNGTAQVGDSVYISHVAGDDSGEEPEDPVVTGKFTSQDIFFANIIDTNKAYSQEATINDESCTVLKLGTSSVVGTVTSGAVGVSGDGKTLSLYGVAWKDKSGKVVVSVDGVEVTTLEFAANSGATGNSPYTLTIDETADYYTVALPTLTESSTITLASVSGATRVIMAGINIQ